MGRSKYGNVRTVVDGITFDSKREAARYAELAALLRVGVISSLVVHKTFKLVVNGHHVCDYECDFWYFDNKAHARVCEDAKGVRTPVYLLKKELMRACLGIEIREV